METKVVKLNTKKKKSSTLKLNLRCIIRECWKTNTNFLFFFIDVLTVGIEVLTSLSDNISFTSLPLFCNLCCTSHNLQLKLTSAQTKIAECTINWNSMILSPPAKKQTIQFRRNCVKFNFLLSFLLMSSCQACRGDSNHPTTTKQRAANTQGDPAPTPCLRLSFTALVGRTQILKPDVFCGLLASQNIPDTCIFFPPSCTSHRRCE